ncbi:membrane fusion protein, multidrug efflux system [Catalinimonas alkaloidigena]|uniref:Membrane fusion protein, multidrug efflux system n=1 Tax=Catalinimonas alkaloidigena TaxID=1075417 RepID=A0A1G9RF79_9BACT|nr:efflux RND transporter periplasmic adaptor subunit [Catalinimonas alkaloidigena]SDM21740.1 membrane fusion protein, multidrug efflux system [Catalinimonas alkaloidigena]
MKRVAWIETLIVTTFLAACNANSHVTTEETSDQSLPVTELILKDTTLHHEYVTDIQAVQNVEIRARVPGFLEDIYVDEGQQVKKGQPLFRINAEEYKAQEAKANANLESAIAEAKATELEVDRVRILVDKDIISQSELEVAKAKNQAARARIEEARSAASNAAIRLSYTYIRAPFDGLIDRIPLKVGSLIEEGTLLTTVSDISSIYAYFNVSEREYLEYTKSRLEDRVNSSNVVNLVLADGTRYPYEGKVETMEGEFEASTGSIAFRAHFPNPEQMLKHGATGKVRLTNKIKDALIVPQKAVFEIQDKNYVFVVDSTNTVRMQSFSPASRFSYFYIVNSGLKPGDRVVYEGVQSIRDGAVIKPEFVVMDSLLASAPRTAF